MAYDWTSVQEVIGISTDDTGFFDLEAIHRFDANGDGVAGTFIADVEGTKLSKTTDGRLYADSTPIRRNGLQLSETTYSAFNYDSIRAGTINGNKFVALRRSNNVIWEWEVDDNWNWIADVGTY